MWSSVVPKPAHNKADHLGERETEWFVFGSGWGTDVDKGERTVPIHEFWEQGGTPWRYVWGDQALGPLAERNIDAGRGAALLLC